MNERVELSGQLQADEANTTATIPDEGALPALSVADQLGHSRLSMKRDVYMRRRAVDSQAAPPPEAASRGMGLIE